MSENIMQTAEKALEYWDEDSMWARLIERDIDANDLESLQFHVDEANNQMSMQEDFARKFQDRLLGDEPLMDVSSWPKVKMPVGIGDCEA